MNLFNVTIALVLFLSITAHGDDFELYYLGGQSNMDGYGWNQDLPALGLSASTEQGYRQAYIFHGSPTPDGQPAQGRGSWQPLQPGHGVGFKVSKSSGRNLYSERFGPELSFVDHLFKNNPERNIAIIKYSKGGTAIDVEAAGIYGCWHPDYSGPLAVNQYDHFLATLDSARSQQDIDGDGKPDMLIPKGIIWMQGESDGVYTEDIAKRYGANLSYLMDHIRAALSREAPGLEPIPIVLGQISDSGQGEAGQAESRSKVWKYGETIRQAQQSFVDQDTLAALIKETDQYGYSDPYHYDSSGYVALGNAFARAIIRFESERKD